MLEEEIKELEKLCKPIIHCNYTVDSIDGAVTDGFAYEISWLGKEFIQYIKTMHLELKENGVLITDDFIFIKELL